MQCNQSQVPNEGGQQLLTEMGRCLLPDVSIGNALVSPQWPVKGPPLAVDVVLSPHNGRPSLFI